MKLAQKVALVLAAMTAILPGAAQARTRTILFIGNSFTQGAYSPVVRYGADRVTDLNKDGFGGVPALFATFARQAKQDWKVSLETQGGRTLGFHWDERRKRFDKRWDAVVLQEYSTLDPKRPGDPTYYHHYAPLLADLFHRRNRDAQVWLMQTWSRADQAWQPKGNWYGKPIEAMANELYSAATSLCTTNPRFAGLLPVGNAWNSAFASGLADPNPYDGVAFGQVSLWTFDHYHASAIGYYLEALVVFGRVTGVDPRTLGRDERAASDLGMDPKVTEQLQAIAAAEIAKPDPCRPAETSAAP